MECNRFISELVLDKFNDYQCCSHFQLINIFWPHPIESHTTELLRTANFFWGIFRDKKYFPSTDLDCFSNDCDHYLFPKSIF